MTYEQAFAKIKKTMQKSNTKNLTTDFAVQINLVDEDCSGIFYVAFINNTFAVEPYDYVDNNAIIYATESDFTDFVEGKINVDSEKISVDGDINIAKLLYGIAKPAVKKAAAKATKTPAAKKAETAKTPAAKKTETTKTAAKKTEPKKSAEAVKTENTKNAAAETAAKTTTVKTAATDTAAKTTVAKAAQAKPTTSKTTKK